MGAATPETASIPRRIQSRRTSVISLADLLKNNQWPEEFQAMQAKKPASSVSAEHRSIDEEVGAQAIQDSKGRRAVDDSLDANIANTSKLQARSLWEPDAGCDAVTPNIPTFLSPPDTGCLWCGNYQDNEFCIAILAKAQSQGTHLGMLLSRDLNREDVVDSLFRDIEALKSPEAPEAIISLQSLEVPPEITPPQWWQNGPYVLRKMEKVLTHRHIDIVFHAYHEVVAMRIDEVGIFYEKLPKTSDVDRIADALWVHE